MALKLKRSAVEKIHGETPTVKSHTILLVDDEERNLSALSRILAPHYSLLTAEDGRDALELIKRDETPSRIQLIISDQRMPLMTGVEFLKQTIPIIPRTIRMILTGFTDIDAIIDSINEGRIYKFLTKPIEPQEFLLTVKRAIEAHELEQTNFFLVEELKTLNRSLEQKVSERTFELRKTLEILEEKNRLIISQRDRLEQMAKVDGLTNIPNRRRFDEVFTEEWKRCKRSGAPLAVAMIDIDFFKQYNDTYGHDAGDDCLKRVARALAGAGKRPGDFMARYGGEEFVALLPGSDAGEAFFVAQRIKAGILSLAIEHSGSKICDRLTVSIGLASVVPVEGAEPESVMKRADQMLYKAKKNGRNRIESGA